MTSGLQKRRIGSILIPAFLAMIATATSKAYAQNSPEAFYSGKTLRLIVGYPAGTVFDTYSRMTLRHMVRHIPGKPIGIVQNMPGAGGLSALVYVANVADPDGLSIALSSPQNTTDMLLDPTNAKFDPTKVSWIGSVSSETASCVFWGGKGQNLNDLKNREHLVGTTGPTSGTDIAARALEGLFQYRFKYVSGYRSTVDIRLAAERGEVDGMCGLATSTILRDMPTLLHSGTISAPVQMGLKANPGLPNAPNVLDIASTREEKQIITLIFGPLGYFRMIMAAGSVPPERIAALRTAFDLTMKDPEFLADMEKARLDVLPLSGAELASQINDIYKTPADVVERTLKILGTVR
jgi:tripartite-type tricarboxylate transporter receptor subunit TctC